MGEVLARRGGSIVAAEAATGDRTVVEASVAPAVDAMAVLAPVRAGNVARRLPPRGHVADVAASTIVTGAAVVHAGRFPETRDVAVAARTLNRNVRGGRACFGSRARGSMTIAAGSRSPLELTIDMAAFAVRSLMPPVEWETGQIVVEIRSGWLRLGCGGDQNAHQNAEKEAGKAKGCGGGCHSSAARFEAAGRFEPLDGSRSAHCLPLPDGPKDAGFHALEVWQLSQFRPKAPRWTSSPEWQASQYFAI